MVKGGARLGVGGGGRSTSFEGVRAWRNKGPVIKYSEVGTQNDRGGESSEVLPLQKGVGRKVVAMLKDRHNKF